MMFCVNCGTTLSNSATFCPMCGRPVAGAPAQAAGQQMGQAPAYAPAQAIAAPVGGSSPWARNSYATPTNVTKVDANQAVADATAFSPTLIARFIAIAFLFISMFLPWVDNVATVFGQTQSVSYSYLSLVNALGVFLFIAGVAAAAVGTGLEVFAKRRWGRWISVAGFAVLAFLAILIIANMSQSADVVYASESVAPTFVAWLALIASGFGIVSCIIKH